jgi:predicted secreted protein
MVFCHLVFIVSTNTMKITTKLIATGALLTSTLPVFSQNSMLVPPQNVVQLSASGVVEVQQDLLVLTLHATRDGKDAATVQAQLRQALDGAVQEARKGAEPGAMDVRTGQFSLSPRYGPTGQITGWQGRAEVVLEGRDFGRITATAARIHTMVIGQVGFGLSRAERTRAERDAQGEAIRNFKTQAADLSQAFGFGGYTLREVAVSSHSSAPGPRPRMMAMEAKMASADAPIAVEAGKSTVEVTVSGAVQMR